MSAYMVAALSIDDADGYSKYVPQVVQTLEEFQAEVLVLAEAPDVLEGSYLQDFFVLVKFRDREHLQSWYDSPQYVEARQIRFRTATTAYLIAVDGLTS